MHLLTDAVASLFMLSMNEFILPHILFRYADVVTQTFALLGHTLGQKDFFVQQLDIVQKMLNYEFEFFVS